ncbi:hypothetical protein HDV00_004863 [Rhizophlyctis rosea]|nr:hypothetical protein HDV00_004863 [Rhizophlyctis rosea]
MVQSDIAKSFKPARLSAQFTFSTRFPRKPTKNSVSAFAKKGKPKKKVKAIKVPGLVLPSRLQLAHPKRVKQEPTRSERWREEEREVVDNGREGAGPGEEVKPMTGRQRERAVKDAVKQKLREVRKEREGWVQGGEAAGIKDSELDEDSRARILQEVENQNQPEDTKGRRGRLNRGNRSPESRAKHNAKFALSPTGFEDFSSNETLRDLHKQVRQSRFEGMGLCEEVVQAVKKDLGMSRPTEVQALCIPEAVKNPTGTILCAAETGSGKTLAYLLPIFHHLRMQEKGDPTPCPPTPTPLPITPQIDILTSLLPDGTTHTATSPLSQSRKLRKPRAIIIVPTRDLVRQVTTTAKKLSHTARLRVTGFHARTDPAKIKAALGGVIDVLVTTPTTLLKHLTTTNEQKYLSIGNVRHLVVDEADTLFDAKNSEELSEILDRLKTLKHPYGTLYTTATLPRTLLSQLHNHHPQKTLTKITTPTLHRTLPKLHQAFIRIGGSSNVATKQNALVDVLKRAVEEDERIMVFVNRRQTGKDLCAYLLGRGYLCVDLSSKVDVREREGVLRLFTEGGVVKVKGKGKDGKEGGDGGEGEWTPSKLFATREEVFGMGKGKTHVPGPVDTDPTSSTETESTSTTKPPPLILIATDLASRGVDTTAVGHVINYDFPQTAIDYLHRVGRTARNGGRGRATSLVGRKDRYLAEMIEGSVRRREVLA